MDRRFISINLANRAIWERLLAIELRVAQILRFPPLQYLDKPVDVVQDGIETYLTPRDKIFRDGAFRNTETAEKRVVHRCDRVNEDEITRKASREDRPLGITNRGGDVCHSEKASTHSGTTERIESIMSPDGPNLLTPGWVQDEWVKNRWRVSGRIPAPDLPWDSLPENDKIAFTIAVVRRELLRTAIEKD
jgi:hypothetical protein